MSNKKGAKFYYSQGFTQSTAKKICIYFLGDYFFKLESNHKERRYECFIKNKIIQNGVEVKAPLEEIKDFQKYWNIYCIILDTTNL